MEQIAEAPAVQRRRGRPQRLPFEATPFSHPTIDADARLAWLLAASRLLSPATAADSRADFLERVRARGVTVDTSRISRWESGQLTTNHKVLEAYESVIGLPDGTLWAAHSLLHRSAGEIDPERTLRAGGPRSMDKVDELFDLIEIRQANGSHWLRMASDLVSFDRVYMHRTTWTTVSSQLVSELTRSSGIAFLRRFEAACALMTHPQGRRNLTKSLGRFLMHPDAQNVAPSITLLREVADHGAGDLVLRMMSDDNKILRRGANGVAGSIAARGHFPSGSVDVLERHAGHELTKRGAVARRTDAIELAVQLPQGSYDRVVAAIPDPRIRRRVGMARETMELVPRDLGRAISEGIASFAEAATKPAAHDPDQMLRRLIREALFHVQRERRHLAAMLLGVSPYGAAVARAVLELASDPDDLVASMCWSMLRRMGHLLDRSRLTAAVLDEGRDGVRARALVTLGFATGCLEEDAAAALLEMVRSAPADGLRHAALFALGMADHDHLRALRHVEEHTRAAAWWRALGPAIHDVDVVGN